MEINFNVNLSMGVPNPIRYAYDLIHDYVWEGPEDENEEYLKVWEGDDEETDLS